MSGSTRNPPVPNNPHAGRGTVANPTTQSSIGQTADSTSVAAPSTASSAASIGMAPVKIVVT